MIGLRRILYTHLPFRGEPNPVPADLPSPRSLSHIEDSLPILEAILQRNILSTWYPGVVDEKLGGYRGNMDASGRWAPDPDGERHLMNQTRTLWFFSSLASSPYGDDRHLAVARHGFDFLRYHMWDAEHGGFFWEFDAATNRVVVPHKSICGQSYALYAIAEYALVSHDSEAEALARRLFAVMENQAKDPQHPGYYEVFSRDWQALDGWNPIGPIDARHKTMDTHVHLMESITTYYQLTGEATARQRLEELIQVIKDFAYKPHLGLSTSEHYADWSPVDKRTFWVSYGHDLETIWLVMDTRASLGSNSDGDLAWHRTVFASCLKRAWDKRRGGYYFGGMGHGPALRRQKFWWVQAEALVAALTMYQATGDHLYARNYLELLDWIVVHQIDWRHGEWHLEIAPNGRTLGPKIEAWKSCYHNGRAILRCLAMLNESSSV